MKISLSSPYIAPYRPEMTLDTAGTYTATQVNAFMADCVNHGYNEGYLKPGLVTANVAVAPPAQFDLIGMGKYDGGGFNAYTGGVKIQSPVNSTTSAIALIGTTDGYNIGGAGQRPGIVNLCAMGAVTPTQAIAGPNPPIVDFQNVYKPRVERIYSGNDFLRAFRFQNVWDAVFNDLWSQAGGFSDPTVTASTSAVASYTGRSAFMSIETIIGRSLGVPSIEIVSPNTTGSDVSNNILFNKLHIESNAANGVPFMARGGNGSAIKVLGGKIEATQGCVPMLVIEGQHGFHFDGWLYGGGEGSPYVQIGSVPASTPWANYATSSNPITGGLVLANGCFSPRICGSGGIPFGSSAKYDSFMRFISCEDPKVDFNIEDGLNRLVTATSSTGARMIFDQCAHVSAARTRCYPYNYLSTVTGANTTNAIYINGTTQDS